MARIRLKVDVVDAINALTSDRNKRIAFKRVMANQDAKRDFATRLIDTIIDRTLAGKDKDGDKFAPYSEAYRKSLAFRIYGKSARQVNLRLTGEMQSSIEIVSTSGRNVEIGVLDFDQSEKAEGHIDGANNLPVRDFWGVSSDEVNKILKEVIRDNGSSVVDEAIEQTESNADLTITPSGTEIELEF